MYHETIFLPAFLRHMKYGDEVKAGDLGLLVHYDLQQRRNRITLEDSRTRSFVENMVLLKYLKAEDYVIDQYCAGDHGWRRKGRGCGGGGGGCD